MTGTRDVLTDIVVGLVAGYAATLATKPVQRGLFRAMPKSARDRELRFRGPPPQVAAAERIAEATGIAPRPEARSLFADVIHYGTGMAWGPVYGLLRRHSGMTPLGAGLATGLTMALIVDETITPAMGLSAPNRVYPVSTHLRGLATHCAYGLTLAATAEAMYRLMPRHRRPD